MTQNQNNNHHEWLRSWLKPSNLIALAGLIVAIWGGFTFLSNRQNVEAQNNCKVSDVAQKTGSKENLAQNVICKNDSTIEGVTQE